MLVRDKPEIPKSALKIYKKQKWDHADEVLAEFKTKGIPTHVFEASTSTPHIRICARCDYWPASRRFFDFGIGLWGYGWENLKAHIETISKNPNFKPRLSR